MYCVTVTFTNLLPLNIDLALEKAGSRRGPNLDCRGADRPGWCDALPKKGLHESRRMGRRIVVMKLICSLGHCECDGHTVHKLSQWSLTAEWLAPRHSECSRTRSKISSDWLPSYIMATWPVLETFRMDRYFPNSPRMCINTFTWMWPLTIKLSTTSKYFHYYLCINVTTN